MPTPEALPVTAPQTAQLDPTQAEQLPPIPGQELVKPEDLAMINGVELGAPAEDGSVEPGWKVASFDQEEGKPVRAILHLDRVGEDGAVVRVQKGVPVYGLIGYNIQKGIIADPDAVPEATFDKEAPIAESVTEAAIEAHSEDATESMEGIVEDVERSEADSETKAIQDEAIIKLTKAMGIKTAQVINENLPQIGNRLQYSSEQATAIASSLTAGIGELTDQLRRDVRVIEEALNPQGYSDPDALRQSGRRIRQAIEDYSAAQRRAGNALEEGQNEGRSLTTNVEEVAGYVVANVQHTKLGVKQMSEDPEKAKYDGVEDDVKSRAKAVEDNKGLTAEDELRQNVQSLESMDESMRQLHETILTLRQPGSMMRMLDELPSGRMLDTISDNLEYGLRGSRGSLEEAAGMIHRVINQMEAASQDLPRAANADRERNEQAVEQIRQLKALAEQLAS